VAHETNRALAQLFQSIADQLQSRRENPHRIRAYRRAAETVLQLAEDIRDIARRGELNTLPGIGKELAAKTEEYLATARIAAYEMLRDPLPPEAAAWLSLPGLTEPIVQFLYHRLGIRTLDDLEALVRSHLLRTVPGFIGTEESLLQAIRSLADNEEPPPR
jgi:DNA polymerase (family 10)